MKEHYCQSSREREDLCVWVSYLKIILNPKDVLLILLSLPVMCHLPVLKFMVRKEAEVAKATRLGTNSN